MASTIYTVLLGALTLDFFDTGPLQDYYTAWANPGDTSTYVLRHVLLSASNGRFSTGTAFTSLPVMALVQTATTDHGSTQFAALCGQPSIAPGIRWSAFWSGHLVLGLADQLVVGAGSWPATDLDTPIVARFTGWRLTPR